MEWELELIGEPVKDETPIYDAIYAEYRANFWQKLGFIEVKED